MHCPNCNVDNSDQAKFCEKCGAKLVRVCPQCAREMRPTAKFCAECGTPIMGHVSSSKFQVSPSSQPLTPSTQVEGKAAACFIKAIDIARQQQAKSLELRATTSLARLWQQQSKHHEARAILFEVYNWFTEGFDTKDLQEAKTLLEELT